MANSAQNEAVGARWFGALWGRRSDFDVIAELAAPDLLFQSATDHICRGPHETVAFLAQLREAFPDFCLCVGDITSDGDTVIVRWEGGGTHTGPEFEGLQMGPLEAGSRRKVLLVGHSAIQVKDGRVAGEAVWSATRLAQAREFLGGLVL
jgi:SnoaL-like polyketide cyclase